MKLLLAFALLFQYLKWPTARGEFRAYEIDEGLQISTPSGTRILFYEKSLKNNQGYRIEIPLSQLQLKENIHSPGVDSLEQFKMMGTEKLTLKTLEYFKNSNYFMSLHLVDTLLERNPDHQRFLKMKGSILYKLGEFDLAKQYWNKAKQLNPADTELKGIIDEPKP